MKKRQINKWLKITKDLREYYQGKNNKYQDHCPLCRIASGNFCPDRIPDCFKCLWVLFEHKEFNFSSSFQPCYSSEPNIVNLRELRDPEWCRNSIDRLKRWEEKLLAMKEEKP